MQSSQIAVTQSLDTRQKFAGQEKTMQATRTHLHQYLLHLVMNKYFTYAHYSCIPCEKWKKNIGGGTEVAILE